MPLFWKTQVSLWALCGVLLSGCGSPQQSSTAVPTAPQSAPTPAGTGTDSTTYVFDLSALTSLTADQGQAQLGKPLHDEQESIAEEFKTLLYQRRGYKLSVDYEVRSRRLHRLDLRPPHPTADYAHLLAAANVTEVGQDYRVEPLEMDGLYSGVSVTPDNARVMNEFGKWVPDTLSR